MGAQIKGWWRFDGNLQDSSGTGLNGTEIGAPAFDSTVPVGRIGQSVLFDNDSEGVRIAANAVLSSQQFTLGYSINLLDVPPGTSGLERLSARQNYQFETAIGDAHAVGGNQSPSGITLSYYGLGTGGWKVTNVEIPATGWVHVVWRNSATEMLLYINGVQAYSGVPVTAPPTGYMNFGTSYMNAEGFGGLMDDAFYSDGLLTPQEIANISANGVASFLGDSDGDGLPNVWENQYGLDPNDNTGANGADGNDDNDGLTNAQEYARGTDPTKTDTDGDGLNDGDEVTRLTNPLAADSDGDGLSDGDEVTRSTNPLVVDTDGDGADDGAEVTFGSDPKDALSLPPPQAFLVLWLNFEGDARDSSSKANHGSLLDAPAFVDDGSPGGGQAISLTTNPMGVLVPGNASLAPEIFTLSYWVKPTSLQEGNGLERLTGRAGFAFETAIGNRAAVGGGADLTLSYYQGNWISSGHSLTLNEWSHVAWRNTGTGPEDMTLWVDGVKKFTGPGLPAGSPGNGLMTIGTLASGAEGFEGMMDDVRLYRKALADDDMTALAVPGAQAAFEITSAVRAPNGASVTLKFRSRTNRVYAVDYSTDLKENSWVELTDGLHATGGETQYVDMVASNRIRAFYRVRDVTPPPPP